MGMPPVPSARQRRFEAVFGAHYDAILLYVQRRCDPSAVDDVVAETFTACWRKLDAIKAGQELAWLYAAARRERLAAWRGQRSRAELTARAAQFGGSAHHPDFVEDVHEAEVVMAALESLPERDQELLLLIAWEGLPPDTVARALGISVPTMRVRLHRARKRLSRRMDDLSGVSGPVAPTTVERTLA